MYNFNSEQRKAKDGFFDKLDGVGLVCLTILVGVAIASFWMGFPGLIIREAFTGLAGVGVFIQVRRRQQHKKVLRESKELFDQLEYSGADAVKLATKRLGILIPNPERCHRSNGFGFAREFKIDNMEPRSFGRFMASIIHICGEQDTLEHTCRQILSETNHFQDGLHYQSLEKFLKGFVEGATSSRHEYLGEKFGESFSKILTQKDQEEEKLVRAQELERSLDKVAPLPKEERRPGII